MGKKILIGCLILILVIGLVFFIINKQNDNNDNNKDDIENTTGFEENNGKIVSFKYNYGSYNGGEWNYEIYTENNKTYILGSGRNGIDFNIDKEVNASVLEEISKIVKENKIYEWDGFDKRDNNILDGYSFSIMIEYDNGVKIEASGYMKYPDNYEKGHEALSNYLENI